MPSPLFYRAKNRILARRLGETLAGRFARQPEEVTGRIVSRTQAAIGGQRYTLANAGDGLAAGVDVGLVNTARPAAAIYAPAGAQYLGGGAGGGGGAGALAVHELNSPFHAGILARSQAPWAVATDGSRTWLGATALIGPTTYLTSALAAAATTMYVAVDTLAAGDILNLRSRGLEEWVQVTAGPVGSGPYAYTVDRDLAELGALDWEIDDPLLNTGAAGDGWINLHAHNDLLDRRGPALSGYVRESADAWDDFGLRWKIGNLREGYDYDADVFGAAFGRYAGVWLATDEQRGVRIMRGAAQIGRWDIDGTITAGPDTGVQIVIDPGSGELRFVKDGVTLAAFDATTLSMVGWQRWGNPLGPSIETGVIEDEDADGNPVLDANGQVQTRYVLRMLGENGVPLFSVASGTDYAPNDAWFRVGAQGAAHSLTMMGALLQFTGDVIANSISIKAGMIEGVLAFGEHGEIRLGDADSFENGVGAWLGRDTDQQYKLRIGDLAGDYLSWDGTHLLYPHSSKHGPDGPDTLIAVGESAPVETFPGLFWLDTAEEGGLPFLIDGGVW